MNFSCLDKNSLCVILYTHIQYIGKDAYIRIAVSYEKFL